MLDIGIVESKTEVVADLFAAGYEFDEATGVLAYDGDPV